MDRERVQRVLRERRRQQDARACYPCQQRKVKCDKSQPCHTCLKRGHPEICTYDSPHVDAAPGERRRVSSRGNSVSVTDAESRSPRRISRSGVDARPSGHDSVPAILSSKVSSPSDEPLARDARAVLGLQNTLTSYLFTETQGQGDPISVLKIIAPQRKDVVKFYQHYHTHVAPFNPVLIDQGQFELDLSAYLKSETAGELRDGQKLAAGRWATRQGISFIALLLSVTASGAYFSDERQRAQMTYDFAKRSFQALRLANFLFQPLASDIQTLLILGNTLQNIGQSDAAWVLLGTTTRLAHTLANASRSSHATTSEQIQKDFQALRSKVMWQDALLGICYDRPPSIYNRGCSSDSEVQAVGNPSYYEAMVQLSQISIEFMQRKALDFWDTKSPNDFLRDVDAVYGGASPYLRELDGCKDMSQILEHYALNMHISFFVTYICRPAIRNSTNLSNNPVNNQLRVRAKESLISVCQAFIEFQSLTIVPRRTWSMLHEVLSAVLLLYVWEETRDDPECRRLQQQVVDVFTADIMPTAANDGLDSKDGLWLTAQHIRTLLTLREVLGQGQVQVVPPERPTSSHAAAGQNIFTNADGLATDQFSPFSSLENPSLNLNLEDVGLNGLSPLDYLNYYMNGPVSAWPDNGFSFP